MDDFIVDFCSCHRCMYFWVGCALEKKQRIIMNVNSVLRRALQPSFYQYLKINYIVYIALWKKS